MPLRFRLARAIDLTKGVVNIIVDSLTRIAVADGDGQIDFIPPRGSGSSPPCGGQRPHPCAHTVQLAAEVDAGDKQQRQQKKGQAGEDEANDFFLRK